jgi:hypothetical protein
MDDINEKISFGSRSYFRTSSIPKQKTLNKFYIKEYLNCVFTQRYVRIQSKTTSNPDHTSRQEVKVMLRHRHNRYPKSERDILQNRHLHQEVLVAQAMMLLP